jgi:glycine hydroxymethyltransferase
MHVIAAKAVCFQEAAKPSFADYQKQVVANARALAAGMLSRGYGIVSGGTDNHLMLVDLRGKFQELTGKVAQESLDLAHITCNKNTVPYETRSPFQASGIRLGTPAVTTRGMREPEMEQIAAAIDTVLSAPGDAAVAAQVKDSISKLCAAFPLPY